MMFLVRFLLFFRAFSCWGWGGGGGCMLACGRIRFLLELSGKGQWIRQILLCWIRC